MKYKLLFFTLLATILLKAQNSTNSIELEKPFVAFSPFGAPDTYQDKINNAFNFLQVKKLLSKHSKLNKAKLFNVKTTEISKRVNLGLILSEYETLTKNYFNDTISNTERQSIENLKLDASIKTSSSIGILSPLAINHKGLSIEFILKNENILNTTEKEIEFIEIDFNDGLGYKIIQKNVPIHLNYTTKGEKKLKTKITLNNGENYYSESKLNILLSPTDLNRIYNLAVTTFQSTNVANPADITIYNEETTNNIGTGEYDIYLSADGVLDKPIFLVDGFDPGDSRNTQSIYELLNFDDNGTLSNLGDLVRAEGFDVVVLNFPIYTRQSDAMIIDGGVDYIERNAMLLVELITKINNDKIGTEPNVVIGPSMGGLITRYGLNFMENEGLNHDTRLWISFDSPQLGANVPIGFQYLFNRMAYGLDLGSIAGDQSIVAIRPIIDGMLKSSAARQMLTDQFEPHLQNGSIVDFNPSLTLPIAHNFHHLFFNNLNNLTTSGYPENLRKVSMINGSGLNNRYNDKNNNPIYPNREILNTTIEDVAVLTDATFRTRFSPYFNGVAESAYIFIDAPFLCFCDLEVSASTKAFNYTDGIDAASGGLFDLGALAGSLGTDPTINAFFDALQTDFFNFIPSVSGMAFEVTNNEIDWYHTPDNVTSKTINAVNSVTPFDNWYMPDENQPHITLTPENVAFALSEIIPTSLNVNTNHFNAIDLIKNPTSNLIAIKSTKTYNNVNLKIIDLSGRLVYNTKINLTSITKIPILLSRGNYILSLEKEELSKRLRLVIE